MIVQSKLDKIGPYSKQQIASFQSKILDLDRGLQKLLPEKQQRGSELTGETNKLKQLVLLKKGLQEKLLALLEAYDLNLAEADLIKDKLDGAGILIGTDMGKVEV